MFSLESLSLSLLVRCGSGGGGGVSNKKFYEFAMILSSMI
jgi:hypothetical protein